MTARILSGTEPAAALLRSLEQSVARLRPRLVIVQVGNDPASAAYIKRKMQAAASIGLRTRLDSLPEDVGFARLFEHIQSLNADPDVTGFLVQLPLPEALWGRLPEINRAIDPAKDVDGFTAYNLGKTLLSPAFEHLPPATPAGILSLLEHYAIPVADRHAVIVGRSNIVGKPLALMLLNRSATVTVCHRRTADLAMHTRAADVLVSAAGSPGLITADMVKRGAVVIDVGTTRTETGLLGDVAFDDVRAVASAITPVPGGVGPMTVASLLRNCVRAAGRQASAS